MYSNHQNHNVSDARIHGIESILTNQMLVYFTSIFSRLHVEMALCTIYRLMSPLFLMKSHLVLTKPELIFDDGTVTVDLPDKIVRCFGHLAVFFLKIVFLEYRRIRYSRQLYGLLRAS